MRYSLKFFLPLMIWQSPEWAWRVAQLCQRGLGPKPGGKSVASA